MRGRKQTATALKEQSGAFRINPNRRNKAEPKATAGTPKKPRSVSSDPVANAKWKHASQVLSDLGILTVADADQMELYCLNESLLVNCWQEIKANGIESKRGPLTAATRQWNACMDRRLKIMAELGLTTSARSRMHTMKPEDDDPFMEYLNKRAGKG